MTNDELLALRTKQLAACTRVMAKAATNCKEAAQLFNSFDYWNSANMLNQQADELMEVRSGDFEKHTGIEYEDLALRNNVLSAENAQLVAERDTLLAKVRTLSSVIDGQHSVSETRADRLHNIATSLGMTWTVLDFRDVVKEVDKLVAERARLKQQLEEATVIRENVRKFAKQLHTFIHTDGWVAP